MVDAATAAALAAQMRGAVIRPEDPAYERARRVYNGMIDRHPALIARCADVADVIAAVRCGADRDLLMAIRGGGHNAGGLGVCDDGLVIDLGSMRGIRIDPQARTAHVQAGCVMGDVDHATHAFGLAVPMGFISTTGIAGLTLGGGVGHLTRRFGLTIDSLRSADVVLADGSFVHASEDEHEDLFWALRGGGGNFGVVTSFEFELHRLATVVAGPTFWPLERAAELMQWYRAFIRDAPEELAGFFAYMTVPPVEPFPAELRGQKVAAVVWCWTGDVDEAATAFAPVQQMAPSFFGVQPMPLPVLQQVFDAFYPPGLQWYWRAAFVREIPDEAIETYLSFAEQLPTPLSTIHLYPTDGPAQRIDPEATAYNYREANWNQVIVGVDPDPANRRKIIDWARAYSDALQPYTMGAGYVNFLMGDEAGDRVRATYGDNYPRLVAIKRAYDPDNRFRVNHNIDPRIAAAPAEEAGVQPGA